MSADDLLGLVPVVLISGGRAYYESHGRSSVITIPGDIDPAIFASRSVVFFSDRLRESLRHDETPGDFP